MKVQVETIKINGFSFQVKDLLEELDKLSNFNHDSMSVSYWTDKISDLDWFVQHGVFYIDHQNPKVVFPGASIETFMDYLKELSSIDLNVVDFHAFPPL